MARSARYRNAHELHAPITETPFDCLESALDPSYMTVHILSDVIFMSLFGRPMWRWPTLKFIPDVLAEVTEGKQPDKTEAQKKQVQRNKESAKIIVTARSKLLCNQNPDQRLGKFSTSAQTAILDCRIMLPFNLGRTQARELESNLVASHMCTVVTIPRDREYFHSGYPSEPILAEAAAHQLQFWRGDEPGAVDPAVHILEHNLVNNLIARGEVGEALGRMLLVLARDRAAVEEQGEVVRFSQAVSVQMFLEQLFSPGAAKAFLDSLPNNQSKDGSISLCDAFKNGVINFTHWAKWADESIPKPDAALACFVRSMAAICKNSAAAIDAFIPIWLPEDVERVGLTAEDMTGILIQFKLCRDQGVRAKNQVLDTDVHMFDSTDKLGARKLPYITLIMELGVNATKDMGTYIPEPLGRSHHPLAHPRYSIFVYGCSQETYNVIQLQDQSTYKVFMDSGLLNDHPRQDEESLAAAWKQKLFFTSDHGTLEWIKLSSELTPGKPKKPRVKERGGAEAKEKGKGRADKAGGIAHHSDEVQKASLGVKRLIEEPASGGVEKVKKGRLRTRPVAGSSKK